MAHAVVLGATGHIGAHIVRALLAEGHDVRAAYRNDRYLFVLDGLPIQRVRVDFDTPDGLRDALDGCDWVFHAAGYYPNFAERRERAIAQGVEATRRVLAQIRLAAPRRVVFTSSAATIRRRDDRLSTEQDAEPCLPAAPHGVAAQAGPPTGQPLYTTVKIAMEQEALRASAEGLPVVIVNPSVCLGEYDAHAFSGRAILVFAKHRLPFYLAQHLNVVYTGDVGVGHVRAAERGRLGERYLLTCRNIEVKAFAELVARAAGVPPPRWRLPYRVAWAAAIASEGLARVTRRPPLLPRQAVNTARRGQRLDGSKALRELSLPQTPIEEAVSRALAWFKQYHYL